ncbi:hypothetical protein PU634_04905 [Oceanimonas pelagia]|uniref:Uncharacterized protein n=1 Tax=Oceanimonas pelagia TaxID=3028314 RepID=A0AA50KR02_9GAMM|nr:hypothetical protein [Oceanimonas pelagia]WMC11706.1 hypothetical protein PU634_04905 [Oceanimonas pelagia]
MLNHHPSQIGIWFEYDGGRYKDVYHIRLHSGEELRCMYPNGNAWFRGFNGDEAAIGRDIRDIDVSHIMLAPDEDLHELNFTGEERLKRNLRMFAGLIPELEADNP